MSVVGEYAMGLAGNVVPLVLPLIVVARLGTTTNAFFAMPWLIASSVSMLLWNISASLIVEAASGEGDVSLLLRKAWRLTLGVVILAMSVEVVAAPLVLAVLGKSYVTNGTTLLRLMGLMLPFNVILMAWSTVARLRGSMRGAVGVQVASALGVTLLSWPLCGRYGVNGIGWAYLTVQGSLAVLVFTPLTRVLRELLNRGLRGPRAGREVPVLNETVTWEEKTRLISPFLLHRLIEESSCVRTPREPAERSARIIDGYADNGAGWQRCRV